MLDDVSELEFGSVFDALDVGIVVLDGQGCIVGWNDWIARASRHSEQSVLGKSLYFRICAELPPRWRNRQVGSLASDAFLGTLPVG
jgi:PAS domain-containing protein